MAEKKRLMNKDVIDSVIRIDGDTKTFVLDEKNIISAPIRFNPETYNKEDAMKKINDLTKHLWQRGNDGKLTYMDDLRDEMIQPLLYQVAYEEAMQVMTGYMDEYYCHNMKEFMEIVDELRKTDKRICTQFEDTDDHKKGE